MQITFERLKARAREQFSRQMEQWPYNKNIYDLLLGFVLMAKSSRNELLAIANAFEGKSYDYLAAEAKAGNNCFAQMLLAAREQGISLIERWDVRQVRKLIDAFPSIVATQYRNGTISAALVDNEDGSDCDWIVSIDKPGATLPAAA